MRSVKLATAVDLSSIIDSTSAIRAINLAADLGFGRRLRYQQQNKFGSVQIDSCWRGHTKSLTVRDSAPFLISQYSV